MLRTSLAAVEYQFGQYSIEMANELQKYTDVLLELVQAEGAQHSNRLDDLVSQLERASAIYRIHYGVWSKSYKEIMHKMETIKR